MMWDNSNATFRQIHAQTKQTGDYCCEGKASLHCTTPAYNIASHLSIDTAEHMSKNIGSQFCLWEMQNSMNVEK